MVVLVSSSSRTRRERRRTEEVGESSSYSGENVSNGNRAVSWTTESSVYFTIRFRSRE